MILKDYIFKNLDRLIALLFIIFGLVIILLYFIAALEQIEIGFTLIFIPLIHLLLRSKFMVNLHVKVETKLRLGLIMRLLFYLLSTTIVSIWYSYLYYRPVHYFIIISILTSIIAIEILCFKEDRSIWPIFLEILVLSSVSRAYLYYNFPGVMGTDAFAHAKIIEILSLAGTIPSMDVSGKYYYYPIFHLFVAVCKIICGLNIKDSLFLSIGLGSILITIILFIIGKNLGGTQAGLISALLFNMTNSSIVRGVTNITPDSLSICYYLLLIFFIFKTPNNPSRAALILIITAILIITHPLSSFVILISLLVLYLTNHISGSEECTVSIGINYITYTIIGIQSYWMYTYVYSGRSFFQFVLEPLIDVLKSGSDYGSNILIIGSRTTQQPLETLILHLSYLILPILSIGGVLFWLSIHDRKRFQVAMVICTLFGIIYIIPLMGIKNFLTDRWLPFLSVFLVISAAVYILLILQSVPYDGFKLVSIISIFFSISFLMVTTPGINTDNPLIYKNDTVRVQFEDNEIYTAKLITSIYNGSILTDVAFIRCLSFYDSNVDMPFNFIGLDSDSIGYGIVNKANSLILLRICATREPIMVQEGHLREIYKAEIIPKDLFDSLNNTECLVYNDDYTYGYYPNSNNIYL